jgi:hypothetical protein
MRRAKRADTLLEALGGALPQSVRAAAHAQWGKLRLRRRGEGPERDVFTGACDRFSA